MAAVSVDVSRRYGVSDGDRSGSPARCVWFGKHRIAVADIISVDADEARNRPVSGLLLTAFAFVVSASIFAFLILESGWRDRYLIAVALLLLLGLSALREVLHMKVQRFFNVRFATRSSGQITFASAEEDEVRDFINLLHQEGVPVRRAG